MTIRIREAAKYFRVHPTTINGWIRQGAPTASLGSVGPGCGSRVAQCALCLRQEMSASFLPDQLVDGELTVARRHSETRAGGEARV